MCPLQMTDVHALHHFPQGPFALLFFFFHTAELFINFQAISCSRDRSLRSLSFFKTDTTFSSYFQHGLAASHFSLALFITSSSGPLMKSRRWTFNIFWLSLVLDLVLILSMALASLSGQVFVIGVPCMTSASFMITGNKVSCVLSKKLWRASSQ